MGRAAISADVDEPMTMRWLTPDGEPAAPICTPTEHGDERLPASFVQVLEAFVAKKDENGDDYGVRIAAKDLPAVLRRRYRQMERTIADGTGIEKAVVEGVTVFVLHDYSCVSSAHFYTPQGTKLLSVVG